MPARLNLSSAAARAVIIPLRPRPAVHFPRWSGDRNLERSETRSQLRSYSANANKDLPVSEDKKGPNTEQLPHVSEEAAMTAKTTGDSGPDLQQGTPIEEIVKDDPEAIKNLPKVMRDELKKNSSKATKPNTRQYHTSSRFGRPSEVGPDTSNAADAGIMAAAGMNPITVQPVPTPEQTLGHKFGIPSLPLHPRKNLHYRDEPIVDQLVGLLIQDGKKAAAQRNVDYVLSHLRSSPPPKLRADRPLVPGHPPPSHLPLNPILYLQVAIDSVAPMLRIRSQRGAAGGGVALQIPVPLYLRQRRRTAIMWIIDSARKRKNRGSGKDMFAQRLAEEIVAIVEGRSSVWEKRNGIHKVAVTARANLLVRSFRKSGGKNK